MVMFVVAGGSSSDVALLPLPGVGRIPPEGRVGPIGQMGAIPRWAVLVVQIVIVMLMGSSSCVGRWCFYISLQCTHLGPAFPSGLKHVQPLPLLAWGTHLCLTCGLPAFLHLLPLSLWYIILLQTSPAHPFHFLLSV